MYTAGRLIAVILFTIFVSVSWSARLCIDPGHGGTDPGAGNQCYGGSNNEKDNVLASALRFKAWLNADSGDNAGGGSWSVYITRSTDVFISLQGRCDISNNNACDRFMSQHNNAYDCSANGTETFSYSATGTGAELRNRVQSRIVQAWGRVNRGNKTANLYVLHYTNAPAELNELAFVDSRVDNPYVSGSGYQDTSGLYTLYAIQEHYGIAPYRPGSGAGNNPPYDFHSDTEGFTAAHACSLTYGSGTINVQQTGDDPFVHGPSCSFGAAGGQVIMARVYVQGGSTTHNMQAFWRTSASTGWDANKSSGTITYSGNDAYKTIYMPLNLNWTGTVIQLRLDFDQINTGSKFILDQMEVDNVTQPPYTFASNAQGWSASNGLVKPINWTACCGWPGVIYVDQNGDDPWITGPLCYIFGASTHKVHVHVHIQNTTRTTHDMQVFWLKSGDISWNPAKSSEVVNYTCGDDQWADVYLPVGGNANWNGQGVVNLRLDFDQYKETDHSTPVRYLVDTIEIQ